MEHSYKRQVSFADTDAAGVVHFSRLLCYAEEAEHDLLEKLGIPLLDGGGWPRVHVDCDYLNPLGVGDTVVVTIAPESLGRSSVLWSFSMKNNEKVVARGSVKSVRVDASGVAVELDASWRDALAR
ncbi:MAG: acyl-CoA thioesterase [Verrucomicrobiae bacterium]|nr:acyl-CoA thioesterase [Verrucomicrobiae bacterium]NNJ42037.1 acyl-CoA thioesterase [Akkermansiaceae bacterium]